MDALARAIVDLIAPVVHDLVSAEVRRVVGELESADHGERLYSVRAAAQRLDMSETSLRRHIVEGRLQVTHVPGRVAGGTEQRVRGADLDEFVRQLAVGDDRALRRRRESVARGRRSARSTRPSSLEALVSERLTARN